MHQAPRTSMVFELFAAAAGDAAEDARRLQDDLQSLLPEGGLKPVQIEALQRLDRLTQVLDGLTRAAVVAAEDVLADGGACPERLAAVQTLSGLADHFARRSTPPASEGDVELFGDAA